MNRIQWMWRKLRPRPRQWVRQQIRTWQAWRRFWREYDAYTQMANEAPPIQRLEPHLFDATTDTPIDPIYFYQDAWAFEHIVQVTPALHVDVASHHKYVALLSKVLPVEMVDIRPLALPMPSIAFKQGSILELPYDDNSLESVSSLCVVEHIGLGRYGDPLDPRGSVKAFAELKRVMAIGGHLYLSVPVADTSYVAFNAGRLFAENELLSYFAGFEVADKQYIVGNNLQDKYEARSGFGSIILLDLVKVV